MKPLKVALLTAWTRLLLAWCQTSLSGSAVAVTILPKSCTCQKTTPPNLSSTLSPVRTSYQNFSFRARLSTLVTLTLVNLWRASRALPGSEEYEVHCISKRVQYAGKKNAGMVMPSKIANSPRALRAATDSQGNSLVKDRISRISWSGCGKKALLALISSCCPVALSSTKTAESVSISLTCSMPSSLSSEAFGLKVCGPRSTRSTPVFLSTNRMYSSLRSTNFGLI
mmetsp:Transcript_94690/g.164295  ORF Transcript_94690/g.164295 Transcript_94690/m.164295 type:complete len:226 (+) Transcript_94690:584-1261(+)